MAESILRHIAKERGLNIQVRSAGTHAQYGYPMTPLAQEALIKLGISPHSHYSKPVDEDLLKWADLILVMTEKHKENIRRRFGGKVDISRKLFLLDERDIEDPYGGSLEDYIQTAERIKKAITKWLNKLSPR